jgi:CheY-like chemotaxis protein
VNELPSILLAEDEEADVLLLRRALKEADVQNPVHVASDGQAAMDFLAQQRTSLDGRLPALIILDLKMPRRNGMDVLKWMQDQPVLCGVPVIVFSSSAHRSDIEQAYALGANGFVVKPPSLAERLEFARLIKQWLKFNLPPLVCTEGFRAAQSAHAGRNFSERP